MFLSIISVLEISDLNYYFVKLDYLLSLLKLEISSLNYNRIYLSIQILKCHSSFKNLE